MESITNPKVQLKRRNQVRSACINCRKSKTACSDERPCRRCISVGLSDTCKDVPRKSRKKTKPEPYEGSDCFKYIVFNQERPENSSPPAPAPVRATSQIQQPPINYYQPPTNLHYEPVANVSGNAEFYYPPQDLPQPHQIQNTPSPPSHLSGTTTYTPSPPSHISSPTDYADNAEQSELEQLRRKLDEMKRDKEQKDAQIASLHNALSTQRLFSGMALTRWKITEPGVCYLQSFSEGFSKLIGHSPTFLHSCFTCVQMYEPREYSSTTSFLRLVGSGRVCSLGVTVPLLRGTGEIITAFHMLFIEFENGVPAFATICTNNLDVNPTTYWNPTMVKLRDYSLTQPQQQKYEAPPDYLQAKIMDNENCYENEQVLQRRLLDFQAQY